MFIHIFLKKILELYYYNRLKIILKIDFKHFKINFKFFKIPKTKLLQLRAVV